MSRGQTETILIASHLEAERIRLAGLLRQAGHGVVVGATVAEALELDRVEHVDVVIADRDLPTRDGHGLSDELRDLRDEAVLIVLCETAAIEETVDLMKRGAFHVLEKPVARERLEVVVQKALEHRRLSRGNEDLKNQLDISEKLAMIGRLASGVAHELNNPLDGVRRYVRLTQEGLESEKQELSEYLERAMSGLGRMASIVRQLLTFSRNVVIENESENLRTMLEEVVPTLAPTGSAAPIVDLENPYLDVIAPRALFQVFVTLIKNALDAVESRGPRGQVKVSVTRGGEGVEVRVEDNGTGIAPENLRRVFEPFFTTKDVGRGTGLGLPISARIVERCGGAVRIKSERDVGTQVTVGLPLQIPTVARARAVQGADR